MKDRYKMPRKEHSHHYIYKTVCITTNRFYIGMHSTSNINDEYIGSGKRLWYSIRKHGIENHKREILEYFPDRISLKKRESELVTEDLIKDPMCMNLHPGGEGGSLPGKGNGMFGKKHSNISKTKMTNNFIIAITKKLKDPIFKKTLHDKRKFTLISRYGHHMPIWKNRKHKTETKEKIGKKNSITQTGERNSQFGSIWVYSDALKMSKRIKNTESIELGWKKGRKLKF